MSLPRPALHHAPSEGWVNDPHGLTFHDGRYHLFFQYVPGRTTWDVACHWGHATSGDLLTWRPEPVALVPDDEDGVWSGGLAVPDGTEPVIFYTGVAEPQRELGWVRRAVAADTSWTDWTKDEVVVRAPEDGVLAFRDPFVQRYGDGWRMLIAGALAGGSGALWTSRSDDLVSWSEPVLAASGPEVGPLWECPSLLEVGGRSVLVLSAGGPGEPHSVTYAFCDDEGDRLLLGPWQRLTYGSLYAASAFHDADGCPSLIAWIRHVGDEQAGWMGVHSLPWSLATSGDALVARPPAALDDQRQDEATPGVLPPVADIEWAPRPGDSLVAPGLVQLDVAGDHVAVAVGEGRHVLPWSGEPLRVVLDGPVLEMFGDGGVLGLPVPATGQEGVLTGDLERARVYRLRA